MLPLLRHQSRPAEMGQMKRERAVGHAKRIGESACRQSVLSGLNQHSENGLAVLLRQCRQGFDSSVRIHGSPLNLIIAEMKDGPW